MDVAGGYRCRVRRNVIDTETHSQSLSSILFFHNRLQDYAIGYMYLYLKKVLFFRTFFIFIYMTQEKREALRYTAWLNLFIGFYNMYLYAQGDWWFNLVVGTLNIGAWVFFRKI